MNKISEPVDQPYAKFTIHMLMEELPCENTNATKEPCTARHLCWNNQLNSIIISIKEAQEKYIFFKKRKKQNLS